MALSRSEYMRAWREANREHLVAYDRARRKASPEKTAAQGRACRKANPEEGPGRSRAWREKNPEKVIADRRAWGEANREKRAEYMRRWVDANREKTVACAASRRARKLQASPVWSDPAAIAKVYADAKLATSLTGIKHHVDHVVPLRSQLVCGLHVENNLEALVHFANVSKGNRYWPDMPGTGSEVPPGAPPPNVTKILRLIRADLKALGYDKNGDKIA